MKKLILLRHGQSDWNLRNLFTGWTDVELSPKGREEARMAGEKIKTAGLEPQYCFTSYLRRAIHTLDIALDAMDRCWLPVVKDWHLNERHYGALQGLNKAETAEKYGDEQVHIWRRSYDVKPPSLKSDDSRFPGNDPRYTMLSEREELIEPSLRLYDSVIVSAHGNSLRALAMMLLNLSATEIVSVEIPTGSPWVFDLDDRLKTLSESYL